MEKTFLRKNLGLATLAELQGKTLETILVIERLCEVCEKPLDTQEKFLRNVPIETREDFEKLLVRAGAHSRAEIDMDNFKIYFYDRSFPGDVHSECIKKL